MRLKLLLALSGIIIGIFTFPLALSQFGLRLGPVTYGKWQTMPLLASPDAGLWMRAWNARKGPTLPKEAVIYFFRKTDDTGSRLQENCTYILSGTDLPSRWWSVAVYNEEGFLPQNSGPYSLTSSKVRLFPQKKWTVELNDGGSSEGSLNIHAAGNFTVLLRLYVPGKISGLAITLTRKDCRS